MHLSSNYLENVGDRAELPAPFRPASCDRDMSPRRKPPTAHLLPGAPQLIIKRQVDNPRLGQTLAINNLLISVSLRGPSTFSELLSGVHAYKHESVLKHRVLVAKLMFRRSIWAGYPDQRCTLGPRESSEVRTGIKLTQWEGFPPPGLDISASLTAASGARRALAGGPAPTPEGRLTPSPAPGHLSRRECAHRPGSACQCARAPAERAPRALPRAVQGAELGRCSGCLFRLPAESPSGVCERGDCGAGVSPPQT